MAHESFEDDVTAEVMNQHFINIKVDREERPDVDAVFMQATQALTGHGGWPMTVFMDHERRPFYAGTYFPPTPRHGMPSFTQVLGAVSDAWNNKRDELTQSAQRIASEAFQDVAKALRERADTTTAPTAEILDQAVSTLWRQFDGARGGFGGAPKFPPSTALEFLLRHHARTDDDKTLQMINTTCEAMARGGMYDQLAGGFARYSVDAEWVVPHFEKMLYDNALLLRVYLHWWRSTSNPLALRVVRETANFLLTELRTPEGGFASALDADSLNPATHKSEEGAFYSWTPQQLKDALGDDIGAAAAELFGVTEAGTFEHGTSTLQLLKDPHSDLQREAWTSRDLLKDERDKRPRPHRDDKVVASWNGLVIAALAEAGTLLDVPEWVIAAREAAELLRTVHKQANGYYVRTSRDGRANTAAPAVLEDYTNMAEGFLTLFQCTGEVVWLTEARHLITNIVERFADGDGGFFDTAHDAEVITENARPRDPGDGPTPSGWAAAAGALLTYSALTGDADLRTRAEHALGIYAALGPNQPRWASWGLAVSEALLDGPREIAIVGSAGDPATHALLRQALKTPTAGAVIALGNPQDNEHPAALLHHRDALDGQPTAYVCRNFACTIPVTTTQALEQLLR